VNEKAKNIIKLTAMIVLPMGFVIGGAYWYYKKHKKQAAEKKPEDLTIIKK